MKGARLYKRIIRAKNRQNTFHMANNTKSYTH